jgi:hypothetical protein
VSDVAVIVPGPDAEDSHAFEQGMQVLIKANRGRFVVSADDTSARQAFADVDPGRVILVSNEGSDDPDVQAHIASGRCWVVTTWSSGKPYVTVFEGGRTVVSTPLPEGVRANAKNITTQLYAVALVHALGLRDPKAAVDPPDTMKLKNAVVSLADHEDRHLKERIAS